jgi:hypothetical protein
MKKRERGRGSNVNDEGKMTSEKKSDEEGKKKQKKGLVGKSLIYRHFSSSAVGFRTSSLIESKNYKRRLKYSVKFTQLIMNPSTNHTPLAQVV